MDYTPSFGFFFLALLGQAVLAWLVWRVWRRARVARRHRLGRRQYVRARGDGRASG